MPVIVGHMMPATNKDIMMDITMGTGTLPQAKSTIIIGPTDMTILRKAYTMVGMPATTRGIVREERDMTTIVMMTRTNPIEPWENPRLFKNLIRSSFPRGACERDKLSSRLLLATSQ